VSAAITTPAVRNGGRIGLLAVQARTDLRIIARSTQFLVGAVAIPPVLFAMFGLPVVGNELPGGTPVVTLLMGSFAAYGVVSLALFTFGELVAEDRRRGWMRTLAATPLGPGVTLVGKLAIALACAAVVVGSVGLMAATAGGVRLPAARWLAYAGTGLGGVLLLAGFGASVALLVRPKAAVATTNLLFLPLAFLSGFFVPRADLPPVLADLAPWLPTHHLGQLLWRAVAPVDDVTAFTGAPPQPLWLHVAVVVGTGLALAGLCAVALRRAAITGRV
jgi:ABC-2 type transport system permease protein